MWINLFVGSIGFVIFLHLFRNIGLYFYNLFFGKKRDLGGIYGRNTYAVVTAGSEGIGFGIAQQLAAKGFNLILVARNIQKLEEAKAQIVQIYPGCQVIVKSFDFTTVDNPSTWDIGSAWNIDFSKIEVSILVNNVGLGSPNGILDTPEQDLINLVKVNCIGQAVLSTYFARFFRKRKLQSAILNVSSLGAMSVLPVLTPYGSTKLFNLYVGEGQGNFDDKIDYYTFIPGAVATRRHNFKEGPMTVSVDQSTDYAMRNFGSYRNVFAGHILHELTYLVVANLPLWLISLVGKKLSQKWKKTK